MNPAPSWATGGTVVVMQIRGALIGAGVTLALVGGGLAAAAIANAQNGTPAVTTTPSVSASPTPAAVVTPTVAPTATPTPTATSTAEPVVPKGVAPVAPTGTVAILQGTTNQVAPPLPPDAGVRPLTPPPVPTPKPADPALNDPKFTSAPG